MKMIYQKKKKTYKKFKAYEVGQNSFPVSFGSL